MQTVGDRIRGIAAESEIAIDSDLYAEIFRELVGMGVNLACFVFRTSLRSACARQLNGTRATCPVLTLFLRFDVDFVRTGIDRHQGNWDDKWALTQPIRDLLNAILRRRGFSDEFISEHTFIFARTLEEVVFGKITAESRNEIKKLVREVVPDANVDAVYWNERTAYLLMHDKTDCRQAKRKAPRLVKAISQFVADADKDACCQDYSVEIEFGFGGVVPVQFVRG